MAEKQKKREITERDRQFYKMGFLNGCAQHDQTVNKLRGAYAQLFEELTRLDREEPLMGVLLDYKLVGSIIKGLRNAKGSYYRGIALRLMRMKRKAQKKDAADSLEVLEELIMSKDE